MSSFTGVYNFIKSENYFDFMLEIGVSIRLRELISTAEERIEISISKTDEGDDEWSIKSILPFQTTEIKFKLGEEFDEVTEDGRLCISMITQDGDTTLFQTQLQLYNDEKWKIYRRFTDDGMKVEFQGPLNKTLATRWYEKVQQPQPKE